MDAHITMNMDEITKKMIFEGTEFMITDYENITEGPSSDEDYICDAKNNPLHLFHTVFQPLVYGAVLLLGLTGNGLLLTVLLKRRKTLRITEIYLVHLALADLLLLLTLPFVVTQVVVGWIFGEFLCKLLGLINRLNLVSGSLLLACIGFDRYLAVVHAIPSLQNRRPKIVHLTCALLWLLCLSLSMPNMVFLSVAERDDGPTRLSCSYNNHHIHANNWMLTNRFIMHLLCFFLPLMVMSYCYTAIIITLCQSQKSLEKQGAIRLALLVTLVFCLCWLPYNITILTDTLVVLGAISKWSCHARAMLDEALIVTEAIGFMHCCLNPILYAFIGVRFRRDLLQLLAKRKCLRVCLPGLRVESQSRSSVTDAVTATTSNHYI
ncbi:C-X-C chemokine receptor type 5 [Triplophysa rosa]|uniref:Interferon regulatory factor 5 n=1 Tax=Triplophysa rosa TaxID=992332 RepID=A0A9W7TS05_TRIRA|nr:C-X-C chemokine receptor type 5 [Triplophysa rosa]KAI7802392.1 interferon regulatory factor 5 [Triplophysa rosa]